MFHGGVMTLQSHFGAFSIGFCCLVPPHAATRRRLIPFWPTPVTLMAHGNPAQQDAVLQAGPAGPSRELRPEEIQYQHVGPAHFGAVTSGVYA